MIRPIEVEAREGHRIWLRYSDGSSGEINLSHLVGRGVFAAWDEPGLFQQVYVAPHRAVAWDADIEICPDALYMYLTRKTFEQISFDVEVGTRDA